jgi:4-amino-4-deoxy-L-arabinose transferase-like glycosyltransferase
VLLVLVRLGVAVHLRGSFFETRYATYDNLGRSLVDGHGFSIDGKPYVEELPVYPLLVAAAYGIGGRHWYSIAVLQTLIDLGSLVLLFALARRLFNSPVGLVAAALFAAYPYLAGQSAQLIDTSVFTLTLIAYFFFVVRAAQTRLARDAALAGVAAGVAYLIRPTILILALAFPALLAILGRERRELVRFSAVAAVAGLLVLVPWTVRNELRFHAFEPGAAKAGTNFWKGNSPHAAQFIAQGKSLDLLPLLPDAPHPPKADGPIARDSWWLHRGLDWVRDHPGEWAHGLRVKLVAFWSWNLNPRTYGDTGLKQTLYTASYVPLVLLALAALAGLLSPGRRRQLSFILLSLGLFTLMHLAIFGYTRLRAPIDLLLMVLASLTLVDAAQAVRERGAVSRARSVRADRPA